MLRNPLTAIDFYKADHRSQYPEGTQYVYSNLTPRSSRLAKIPNKDNAKIVFFGLQYFLKDYLIDAWNEGFFNLPKEEVLKRYQRRMDNSLGKDVISTEHIGALHDLGYLPIRIKALPEGSLVPMKVPVLTVVNSMPEFFWLTNYIETILSAYLWHPITSATTAFEYKKLLMRYAYRTGSDLRSVLFQAHDFSFRGLSSWQTASVSGAAHLTSFYGTDTVCAIDLLEDYYWANSDKQIVGVSVPATEHSVMCMGEKSGELETFRRLINETYPEGIVSIVSDTWDFWKVVTEYVKELKSEILERNGKVVIRPDSGDPLKIICGDPNAQVGTPQYRGALECLWRVFGGTTTNTGHKLLNPHIGLIYGDSITLERANAILEVMREKGFASENVVFGVGSYTYQYVTRDTYGFAVKATNGIVNGDSREIFKDPKTDSGTKKSARGLLRVEMNFERGFILKDQQNVIGEAGGELREVFYNGKLLNETTLKEIRGRLDTELNRNSIGIN